MSEINKNRNRYNDSSYRRFNVKMRQIPYGINGTLGPNKTYGGSNRSALKGVVNGYDVEVGYLEKTGADGPVVDHKGFYRIHTKNQNRDTVISGIMNARNGYVIMNNKEGRKRGRSNEFSGFKTKNEQRNFFKRPTGEMMPYLYVSKAIPLRDKTFFVENPNGRHERNGGFMFATPTGVFKKERSVMNMFDPNPY